VRCHTFDYDENGRQRAIRYPTNSITPNHGGGTTLRYEWTASGQPRWVWSYNGNDQNENGLTAILTEYTAGGSDTSLVQTRTDYTGGTSATTYGYDRNQLVSAVETDGNGGQTGSWSYGYDLAGNRTSATVNGLQDSFGYNAANQLTSRNGNTGFAYDANGNETRAANTGPDRLATTWNTRDQNTGITLSGGTSIPFTYTGLSQDERTQAGGTTFTTSPVGLASQNGGGSNISWVRQPDGTPAAMRVTTAAGTRSYYYLTDNLGSTRALVDDTGTIINSYTYDPYGIARTTTEQVPNPNRYTGGYLDSTTGLYKLGIRYYDPTLGRFTQPDPTGQDPHYTYAGNNPVTFLDPRGDSFARDVFKGVITAGVALLVGGLVYAIPGVGLFAGAIAGACAGGATSAFLDGKSARTAGYQCLVAATSVGIGGTVKTVLRRTVVPRITRYLSRFD
jgi:RHS repeat-associated protein